MSDQIDETTENENEETPGTTPETEVNPSDPNPEEGEGSENPDTPSNPEEGSGEDDTPVTTEEPGEGEGGEGNESGEGGETTDPSTEIDIEELKRELKDTLKHEITSELKPVLTEEISNDIGRIISTSVDNKFEEITSQINEINTEITTKLDAVNSLNETINGEVDRINTLHETIEDELARFSEIEEQLLRDAMERKYPKGYCYTQYPGGKDPIEMGFPGTWNKIFSDESCGFVTEGPTSETFGGDGEVITNYIGKELPIQEGQKPTRRSIRVWLRTA